MPELWKQLIGFKKPWVFYCSCSMRSMVLRLIQPQLFRKAARSCKACNTRASLIYMHTAYLPTCLPTCLPATYLPTYLPTCNHAYITLHYIPFHSTTFTFTFAFTFTLSLRYLKLHSIPLQCIHIYLYRCSFTTLHFTTLHCIILPKCIYMYISACIPANTNDVRAICDHYVANSWGSLRSRNKLPRADSSLAVLLLQRSDMPGHYRLKQSMPDVINTCAYTYTYTYVYRCVYEYEYEYDHEY